MEASGGPPGGRREAMTALVVNKRCVMGKRRRWQHTRGNDLVTAAGRRVTQCDGLVALLAAGEGTTAADKRGAATADGMGKRCLGGDSV